MDWQPHHYHQQRMWSSEPVSPSSFIYTPRGTTPATDPFHEGGDEWGAGSLAKGCNGVDHFSASGTLQHPVPERPPVPRSERNYPAEAYRHHRAQQRLSPSSPRDKNGSSSFPHPHPSQQHVVAYQQQKKHQPQQASSQAFDQSSPAGYPFAAVNWQAVTDNNGPRSADYDEARAFFPGGPRTEKPGPGREWTPPPPRMFCRRPTSPKPRIVSLPDDYEEEGKETMQQRYQQQRQGQQPSGLEGVCGRERGRESTVSAEVDWKEECDTKELEVYHQARGREDVAGYGGGGGGCGGESERPSRLQDLARAAVTAASTPTGILGQRPDRQAPFLSTGNRVSGGAVSEQGDELNRSGTRLTNQMPRPQPPQRNEWHGEAEEAVSPRTVPPSITQQLPKPHSNPSRQGRAPPSLPQMGTFRHRPRRLAPLPPSPASPWAVLQPDVCGRQGVEDGDDGDDDDEMDLEEGEITRTSSCASSMTVHAPPSAVNGLPSSRRRAAAQAVHHVCLEVTRRYLQAQITNWQLRNPPSDDGEGRTLSYHRCCSCCGSSPPDPSGGGRRVRGQGPPRRASLVQRSSPDRHKRRRGPYPSQVRGRGRRGDGSERLYKRSRGERSGAACDADDDDDDDDAGFGTSGTVTPENARKIHGPSQHRRHHCHQYRHQPASIPLEPIQLPPAAGAAIHSSRQTTTTTTSPSPSLLAHTTAICTLAWERARRVGDLDDRAEAAAVEHMSSLRRWAETVALTFRVAVEPSHQKEEEEEEEEKEEECGPIRDGSWWGKDGDGDARGRRHKKSQCGETSRLEDEAMEDLGHVAGAGILLCQHLGDDEGVETIERLMTCRGYGFLLGGSGGASE